MLNDWYLKQYDLNCYLISYNAFIGEKSSEVVFLKSVIGNRRHYCIIDCWIKLIFLLFLRDSFYRTKKTNKKTTNQGRWELEDYNQKSLSVKTSA